jgi:outer membrane protein TolC
MPTLLPLALALAVAQAPVQTQAEAAAAEPVLTLDEALRLGEERNLDLKGAQARLRQADELSAKAWSGYLPQLSVTGSYTRNQFAADISLPVQFDVRDTGSPTSPVDPDLVGSPTNLTAIPDPDSVIRATVQEQDQLAAQAELSQALIAPQLWFLIRNASRGERVAELSVQGARRDILFSVAQAYYGVASLAQALEVSERLLEIAQRQEKDARVRYEAGAIARVGLLRAEIDRARAEQDVRRARNSYLSGRIALATLIDRPADFRVVTPPEPQLPPDLAVLEETALRDRAEVQAARLQVDIARGTRSATVARYLPSIGAFGRYQVTNSGGFTGENRQWAVGLGLQWEILDGGLREADLREASARIAETEAAAAGTVARTRQEVRQAVLDLESARANALKAKEQRDLAAENQRLVDVSYRAGAATAVEQADAVAALRNAEIAQLTETLSAQVAALRVLRAAGVSLR